MSTAATTSLSFLDLINICDNARVHRTSPVASQFDSERLVPLHLSPLPDSPKIGLLRPVIVDLLHQENATNNTPALWEFALEDSRPRIGFQAWLDTPEKRTAAMKELCERWRDTGLFPDVCGPRKWRSEMYPVYADPFGIHDAKSAKGVTSSPLNYALEVERSACALFGIITYGVHMTLYQESIEASGEISLAIWVPTRAKTKPTWPGYLDNTVAGGIPSGMGMFESLVKECMEEASIAEEHVRRYTRSVGSISYFFRTSAGWLQPEVEYVYDMRIPPGIDTSPFEPRPLDGEVECFERLSQDEVLSRMRQGLFKPNCAPVLIDLFIRLGIITPDNEPNFNKIVTRLHGDFDYELW